MSKTGVLLGEGRFEHRAVTWRAFLLAATFALCTPTLAQTISTVAGTGTAGFSGDGGPATAAELNVPTGVFVDAAGNLFIAEWHGHVVRKVDPAGTITTVAGTGTVGFSGDGGPATEAQLNGPAGVFVDAAGNLFIAELDGHRIRKVDPAGTITTVAGTGTITSEVDDDRFIRDLGGEEFGNGEFSGDGGPATAAELNNPAGVFVDAAGNLFITDFSNNRIRKVDPAGTITTVAGGGTGGLGDGGPATEAQLFVPGSVFFDEAGNLFIADGLNHRIRKVDPAGTITTVAGTGAAGFSGDGGPATEARLNFPEGVFVDAVGNLFIGEHMGHRVRKVDPAGTITTVAGTGESTGELFDSGGFSGDGGPATEARLNNAHGVFVDAAGDLFIADQFNHRVRKVAPAITAVVEVRDESLPQSFTLTNYPNPFNPETTIRFDLPQSQQVDLAIYNLAAQRVVTLVLGYREAGSYSVRWDGVTDAGLELASGVYFYRLTAGERVQTRKLLLLR